jgi:hypothetical protein
MKTRVSARMTHWGIRIVCLGFAVGFVGPAQPAVQACDLMCVQGDNGCGPDEHYAYASPQTGSLDGEAHWNCAFPGCASAHQQCPSPSPEDLAVLEHAAIAADRAKCSRFSTSMRPR